jgi:hypothetical protein
MLHRDLPTTFCRAEDLDEDILSFLTVDGDTQEQAILISVGHFGGPGNPDGEDGLEFDFDDTLAWCGSIILGCERSYKYEDSDDRDWYAIEVLRRGPGKIISIGTIHVLWDQMIEVLQPLNLTIPYDGDGSFPEVKD